MSARDVVGLVRLGGGKQSVLMKIEGTLGPNCDLEQIRAEIEEILQECGLTVTSFRVAKGDKKKKTKK